MPPDRSRPRQDPVSCETCRKKKLKCDRDYPCANCVARGTTCVFAGKRGPSTAAQQHHQDSNETAALRSENAAIRERLEKLEQVVLRGTPTSIGETRKPSLSRAAIPSPSTSTPAESEATKGYREDLLWLEGVGTSENARLPSLSPTFRIRVAPVSEIVKNSLSDLYHEHDIPLPNEEEAAIFVRTHTERIDPAQHFTHVPTHKASFTQLYRDLRDGKVVEPNRTVFLLSILASVASLWAFSPDEIPLYNSKQQALDSAHDWTRLLLDVLEQVRRSGKATLETVQATMTGTFLLYHADGWTLKVRALHGSAISVARDLGLHRTDAARNGLPEVKTQADIVDRELRRRIWWHLAATDWSMGLSESINTGTYNISPRQMNVRKPRNISDEELATMPADWESPRNVPTVMSYLVIRLHLGEISRRIADLSNFTEAEDVSIDELISIDDEFERVYNELPIFLRLDEQSVQATRHLDAEHPHLTLQRYIANIMLNARRCKFHGAYLVRAATDASYTRMRLECLRSARRVIQARQRLAHGHWLANTKLSGVLHLFFYAVVILVIDLCVNRTSGDVPARKEEIKQACKVLEDARHESRPAAMFLDSLMAIMQKHRIRLQGQDGPETISQGTEDQIPPPMPFSLAGVPTQAGGEIPDEYVSNLDFDEIWQSYTNLDFGDGQDWDALMRDLDWQ